MIEVKKREEKRSKVSEFDMFEWIQYKGTCML